MRFGVLSLLRYGHFTERELTLPHGEYDLHMIYGSNEAGKSTCQSAVGDLLFGIPTQTSLNFLHANKDLRIGASLEQDGSSRRVLRRKGNKDTLLDETGNPLAETILHPLLGGADRSFFERMFSLNHRRLEAGGREILAAEGRVGQTLFAAGAGLSGLHQVLRRLDQEADALWAPRASKKRAYYAAENRLKEARQRTKEASVTKKNWQNLNRKVKSIRQAQETTREALAYANRRKARAERIRRVLPHLTTLRQYQQELEALGEVASIPEDAGQRLRQAEDARIREQARIDDLERQLDEARTEVDAIDPDTAILRHQEAIDALAEERAVVEQAQRKLPRQEAELDTAWRTMERLARELGWEPTPAAEVLARLPARTQRDELQACIDAHEKRYREREATRTRQLELERELDGIAEQIQAVGTSGDSEELTTALRDAHRLGASDEQIAELEDRRQRLMQKLEEGVAALPGWEGSVAMLATTRVPTHAAIETHRQALDGLAERLHNIDRQREADGDRLESLRVEREQAVRDERAIARETLETARCKRDGLWETARARWLGHRTPTEDSATDDETVAGQLSNALSWTDELADQRFEYAEAAAALARIERDMERAQTAIGQSERHRETAVTELERAQAEWLACWQHTGITPAEPSAMLEWLDRRDRLLEWRSEMAELERRIESLKERMGSHRRRLETALAALEAPQAPESASFAALVEHATETLEQLRERRAQRHQLSETQRKTAARLTEAKTQATDAEAAYQRWSEACSAALAACGLDRNLGPQAARGALQTLGELAGQADTTERLAAEVRQTRKQIIEAFEERVERLLRELDVTNDDRLAAVRRLAQRLAEARQARLKREREVERVEGLSGELKAAREALEQAEARIAQLCAIAGAKDVPGLNEAIKRDARARSLHQAIRETKNTALQAGDGKSLEALQAESAPAEGDQLVSEISELDQVITERTQELNEQSADLSSAELELRKLDGAETAAVAENERQQALSDMGEAVYGYAWKRGAAILLRWSLERYRREKQGPLLSRAGELFSTLTLGGFDHLEVDFDEQDRPELTGLRGGGERVRVSGMSDGTADQLYLALRMAAIEEYLDKASGLPFVADDLFINFDDERAVKGLEVLAALSRRTQVLFFTHHAHPAMLAENYLDGKLRLTQL